MSVYETIYRQRCILRRCGIRNKKVGLSEVRESVSLQVVESSGSREENFVTQVVSKENVHPPQSSSENEIDDIASSSIPGDKAKSFRFSCKKCGKGFHRRGYAEKHCMKNKSWACPICCQVIEHKKNVKRHESSCKKRCEPKEKSSSRSYKCKECGLMYPSKFNLERHELLHGIISTKIHTCEVVDCNFSSNSLKQVKRHITLKHSTTIRIPCSKCDQQFLSRAGLLNHNRWEHGVNCDLCSISFSTERRLIQHKRQVHGLVNSSNDSVINSSNNSVINSSNNSVVNSSNNSVVNSSNVSVVVSRKIGEHAVHKIVYN